MKLNTKFLDLLFLKFLSESTKNKIETSIFLIAIASFLIHLLVIGLVDLNIIEINDNSKLLTNPIAAIYTPFSFILIYEVYLLIYYLPKSITVYIGKQYEIITLILIRRLFKDLASLELTPEWFKVRGDLAFTFDLIATVILFFLISVFYKLTPQKEEKTDIKTVIKMEMSPKTVLFIQMKNVIATILVPIFVIVATYSLGEWAYKNLLVTVPLSHKHSDINGIFFDRFFMILILADVLLLLVSFLRTDQFSKVIRNSGFVISTILIKVSFGTDGLLNSILVVVAVFFGVAILAIHNRYDRLNPASLSS